MDEHDALEHDHASPPRSRAVDNADQRVGAPSPMGNAALASLLGGRGGVDRASPKQQGAGPLDEDIASDINRAKGGGQQMDDNTRGDMESNLGVDLSGVRVHTGSEADHLSRSVQAEAFTTGSDVFFRSGKYEPESTDGRKLLAHELTHVVQQSSGSAGDGGRVSHPDDPHEREASAVGEAVASSPAPDRSAAPVGAQMSVAREAAPEEEEEVAREAAPEEEEEVAREAAPEEEEEVARQAAPEVAREAGPEEEEEPA